MSIEKLIKKKKEQLEALSYLEFGEQELLEFSVEEVKNLLAYFSGSAMMKLPAKEIAFFEWLKKNDIAVWDDLWAGEEDCYQVSVGLLPQFLKEKNGFPICDLEEADNYYFTKEHIKEEGRAQLEIILQKAESGQKLKAHELLLFELQIAPIDIWHFAYRYNVPLDKMKKLVSDMVYNGWLVHLTDRKDLLRYIDV